MFVKYMYSLLNICPTFSRHWEQWRLVRACMLFFWCRRTSLYFNGGHDYGTVICNVKCTLYSFHISLQHTISIYLPLNLYCLFWRCCNRGLYKLSMASSDNIKASSGLTTCLYYLWPDYIKVTERSRWLRLLWHELFIHCHLDWVSA